FFKRYAAKNYRRRISATYVATDNGLIIGYVTVVPTEIDPATLPSGETGLGKRPVPVLLLAMMGVTATRQTGPDRIGRRLTRRVYELALGMSQSVGCLGVVVDPRENALGFYVKESFLPLKVADQVPAGRVARHFVHIATLEQAKEAAAARVSPPPGF